MSLIPIYTPYHKPVVTGSFASSGVSTADLSTYTFSGVALGTAATNRHVVIAANTGTASAADASSVTVGGVSASLVVRASGSDHTRAELWIASVPSGTTGDVVIVWSSAKDRCGYAAWAMYGASASASDTATDADTTPSQTIDIPAGGYLIAAQAGNGSGAARTATWTGPSENYDETIQDNFTQTGASDAYAAAQSGYTVAINFSGAMSLSAMAVASFTPA